MPHYTKKRKGDQWTQEDMVKLYHELTNKKSIKNIARELKRTEGGILSRLKHKSFLTFMEEQRVIEKETRVRDW
jgi:hypothetical protein